MKIDPDLTLLPQPPLPAQPNPPTQGETSVFEAMLAKPVEKTPAKATPEPTGSRAAPMQPSGPNDAEPPVVADAGQSPTKSPRPAPKTGQAFRPSEPKPGIAAPTSAPAPTVDVKAAPLPVPADSSVPPAAQTQKALAADGETALAEAPSPNTPSSPKPAPHDPRHPVRDRAFDFGELGVWGHGGMRGGGAPSRTCGVGEADPKVGAVKGPRSPDRGFPEAPRPMDRDRDIDGPPGGARPGATLARERVAGAPVRNPSVSDEPSDRHGAVRRPSPERPSAVPSPLAAARGAETEGAPADPSGADLPAVSPESASPMNVLVSEGAGGLQVVAAMPDINPDTVARLRRIAESLAREFGLSLAEFSLNGAIVDAPSSPDRKPQWR